MSNTHYFSRSDVEEYWRCPRASYWKRCHGGRGVEHPLTPIELTFGSILHNAVHDIFKGTPTKVVCKMAGDLLEAEWRQIGLPKDVIDGYERPEDFFHEQWWLMGAIVAGIDRIAIPSIKLFGDPVFIEEELKIQIGDVTMLTTPDILMDLKDHEDMLYVEWKTTKSAGYQWYQHWTTAPQFMAAAAAAQEYLKRSVGLYMVCGIVKGEWYDGWLHSPLVHAWKMDLPNGEFDLAWKWADARRKGWYRCPAWDVVSSPVTWVGMMPREVLETLFPMTSPLPVDPYQTSNFIDQTFLQETRVKHGKELLANPELTDMERTMYLNQFFPQHFSMCDPMVGGPCWAKELCWQPEIARDPIGSGRFLLRTSHHKTERDLHVDGGKD